ncbi:MAG: hypothetical protein HYV07_15605 [Deltaproteobacteria bacterium]|nr:hypothetical protein [Deltaproteobacteria bacterium]
MNAIKHTLRRWLRLEKDRPCVLVRPLRSSPRLAGFAAELTHRLAASLESPELDAAPISDNMTSIAPGTFILEGSVVHLSGDLTLTCVLLEAASREPVFEAQVQVPECDASSAEQLALAIRARARRVLLGERRPSAIRARVSA